jgi:hypothetical protein
MKLTVFESIRQKVGITAKHNVHLADGQRIRLIAQLEQCLRERDWVRDKSHTSLHHDAFDLLNVVILE